MCAMDFREHGAAQQLAELPFQHPAANDQLGGDGAYAQRFGHVIVDVVQRGGNDGLVDREGAGGMARHDADRRQEHGSLSRPAAGKDAIQQPGRLEADPLGRNGHARQRRKGQLTFQLVIVHAENRHVVRHPQTEELAHVGQIVGGHVMVGQDGHRLGQLLQPRTDLGIDPLPTGSAGQARQILDMTRTNLAPNLAQNFREARLAQPGTPGHAAAEIAEVPIAAGNKVFGGKSAHGRMIDVDHRHVEPLEMQAVSITGRPSLRTARATFASSRWAMIPCGFHSCRGRRMAGVGGAL